MELFEYIKSQLPQMPNSAIMKQLGASQELIDYVKETPENTNFAIAEVVGGSGSGGAEVWLVGDTGTGAHGRFTLSNVGETDHITELYNNGEKYQLFLNGVELPYYTDTEYSVGWADGDETSFTQQVYILDDEGTKFTYASYKDASTAPTSVEVSVKTK